VTYRTGNHWGVTIVREAQPGPEQGHWHEGGPCEECPREAELVAVVVNGDQDLAARIAALLNADDAGRASAADVEMPTPDEFEFIRFMRNMGEATQRLRNLTTSTEERP
jgi:hypothetical protein